MPKGSNLTAKQKKPLLIIVIFSLIVGSGLGGYLLGSQKVLMPQTTKPKLTPLPIKATPTPYLTANWKAYTDNFVSFRYPQEWGAGPTQTFGSRNVVEFQYNYGTPLTFAKIANYNNATGRPFSTLNEFLGVRIDEAKNITVANSPAKKVTSKGREGHVLAYEEVVFFAPDKSSIISFYYEAENYPVPGSNQILDQILSTFQFLGTSPSPTAKVSLIKRLTYRLPSGWKTAQDKEGNFEVGYNPINTITGDSIINGVSLWKLRPDPKLGYMSFFAVRLLPHKGGSRHQFLYDQMGEKPRKQDLLPHYQEIEYLYNSKSCLFLVGIGISQWPTTWGMCAAGNGQSFLITSYDDVNFVETVQTIKKLK